MISKIDKGESSRFMLASYNDLSQNVMHIEGQLFTHMSFFLTLFIGVLTAAGAIAQLTKQTNQPVSLSGTIGLFALPFLLLCLIGQFEVEMIMQLRVRKIKFIEGIVKAREYFANIDPDLVNYIVLPARLEKTPPYLRVRSEDWFKLVFVISLNTFSILAFWTGLPLLVTTLITRIIPIGSASNTFWMIIIILFWAFWLVVGVLLCIVYWFTRYERMMNYCSYHDKQREKTMGKRSEYDLLEVPISKSWVKRSLSDWFLLLEQRRNKNA